jgi:hypothetical protein
MSTRIWVCHPRCEGILFSFRSYPRLQFNICKAFCACFYHSSILGPSFSLSDMPSTSSMRWIDDALHPYSASLSFLRSLWLFIHYLMPAFHLQGVQPASTVSCQKPSCNINGSHLPIHSVLLIRLFVSNPEFPRVPLRSYSPL